MTARGVTLLLLLAPSLAGAQSLEPRLYLPLPTGFNAVITSYTHTTGDIVMDLSIPITDLRATTNGVTVAYARGFGLLGRSTQVQAVMPIVFSTARAQLLGQDTSRTMNGLADPMLRLAINLKGGPARRPAERAGVRFGTIVGASLGVMLPLGQYDTDRYLNLGANRWSFKPELGLIQPIGRKWALEGYLGVWLFGKNTEFPGPATLTQDPLLTLQGHLIRIFNRRGYLALDGTVVRGGTSEVDGVKLNNFQENARFGATTAWNVGRGHTIKAVFSTGVLTRTGGDFDLFSVGYQYSWGH